MNSTEQAFFTSNTLPASRYAFFLAGCGMGAWAPLVPFAKERAQIGEAELGLLLLGLGTGAMCMMPFVARLANRVGCRSTVYLASAFTAIGLVGLATATSYWVLLAFLLLFGAAIATADVNMNLQGSLVERHHGKQMMSGFHGLFSVGNIFSAGTISLLLWLGLNPVQSIVILALGLGAALLSFGRHMLPFAELEGAPAKKKPTKLVLLLGALCFIAFLVEGSMLDWSAVYLTSNRDMEPNIAGIGYAAFSVTMAVGRLSGDWIVSKLGSRAVLLAGSVLAMGGMALAVGIDHWIVSVLGFVLVGLGISNLVPIFCSKAGHQTVMPVAQALAIINAIGYLGILMGPAAIGFIAHATSLSFSLLFTSALLILVLCSAKFASYK
ncbi:MFS family permease [Pseudomonas viridiflava]|uniref:MFS transporter n=1 Tax=Pseudomonas TaxID=286 RepID=UPI0002DFECC4|nr:MULTISPECIES: MFS transporter [Pseudomonas]MBP1144491.1 MFS family permease [Pseudomonas sp. PvP027]MCK9696602.1 MFS transporter [Pseudomonas syringae pv. syringae]MCK9725374.1 MFS transporter [Pseudomonas syringae pv. syringae]